MKELTIQLNQKYKSFENGFQTRIEGELIILSGVNGAGKSQIINIIKGQESIADEQQPGRVKREKISSSIKIDNTVITSNYIEYRSFKENINIPEVVKSTSAVANSAVQQAYKLFKQGKLSPEKSPSFASSCILANKILANAQGIIDPNITEEAFKNKLLIKGFVWRNEDQFTDFIGSLFYNHAMSIAEGQKKAGAIDGPAFDKTSLGLAPWTKLNNLFKDLKLDYRFRDDYEIVRAEISETPNLFSINSAGEIINTEQRTLKDLSDGEKTIISFCFTSLRKIDSEDKKVLLLDEIDAVLNPSLIESLFIVIKKYFIDKGILVIITTHSPATISLAPDYTNYYEVFKKGDLVSRLIQIDRDDYHELQKVNKRFYNKIDNQSERIRELEATLDSQENILIITEGKTDWKYLIKALKYFHQKSEFKQIEENYFYKFGSQEDIDRGICGTTALADLGETELKKVLANEITNRITDPKRRLKIRIGVFDSDTKIKIKEKKEFGVYSFKIDPDGISTEFLFSDGEIKSSISGFRLYIGDEFDDRTKQHLSDNLNLGSDSQNKAGKKVIIDSDVYNEAGENISLTKEDFAQAIFNDKIKISEESWERFRHIFENILKWLPVTAELSETKC
ncbi:MAG: ATP-binding protein [Candidatus Marinimicrobia bacterium]|nr:ATP-binding protein [Candidatus Neomarinimicrobiota bacterium]